MSSSLENLTKFVATLPGLGPKSAKRLVLHLLKNEHKLINHLIALLQDAAHNIKHCQICGNIDSSDPCGICSDEQRVRTKLCIVEEVGDLWNIENSHHYKGLYHVIGGTISAHHAASPARLRIEDVCARVKDGGFDEIIVANNPTIAGQTTGYYIIDCLQKMIQDNGLNITVTALGRGMPIGSELDYLDESTIGAAFQTRRQVG